MNKRKKILGKKEREDRTRRIQSLWDSGKTFSEIREMVEEEYQRSCGTQMLYRATGFPGGLGRGIPVTKKNAQKAGILPTEQTPKFQVAPMVVEAAKSHQQTLEGIVRELRKVMVAERIERIEITRTEARAHRVEALSI